ncbi:MAG: hypothetical protein IPK17_30660 [Chloroflexi bacterium]|uniref:hypothetical protein n=1 Tax=Candidatus Flexifilum breve TaxID=3140694 RepID=UPI00313635FA|nr:hypothetical protein [Chloroflexota bacterium]
MENIALDRLVIESVLAIFVFTVLVVGSLAYNARLWMHDYPPVIRDLQAPLTAGEKRLQTGLAAVLLVLIVGGLFLSGQALESVSGGSISFVAVFVHLYIIFNVVNLWDAVVLDWFMILVLKPAFVFLPGSEAHMDAYTNWPMHITNYFKGVVIGAVISAVLALAVVIL